MSSFTSEHSAAAGWSVVEPRGQIDAATAPVLRRDLEAVASRPEARVLVDLSGVDFLDSTGLGVLVAGLRRARAGGGTLRVVCRDPRMLELFRVAGLVDALTVCSDRSAAMANPSDT